MKKKVFIFALVFFTLLTFVSAIEIPLNQIGCSTFELGKSTIIDKEIPEEIPYTDEIFNVYLEEEIFGYLEISEGKVKDIGCVENENYTYEVKIESVSTIKDLAMGEDKLSIFKEKISEREIEVKGKGIGKKMKWFFTKIALKWMR
jgi:hypothetical protein